MKHNNFVQHENQCSCSSHNSEPSTEESRTRITKEMVVREVAKRWPQTVAVFGNHKVDFCCGGAHSIEQTAQARGCKDIDALIADLNQVIR